MEAPRGLTVSPDGTITPEYISAVQKGFVESRARYPAYFSGYGGGKTWAGSAKAVDNCLDKYPGYHGMIIAPRYEDLITICIPETIARFEEVGINAVYHGSQHLIYFYMDMGNGTTKKINIYCRTGQKPEAIVGIEVAWVWIDEAALILCGDNPTKHVKKKALARIRGKGLDALGGGQLFITTTHEGDLTWVCDDWVTDPKPGHVSFIGSTFDNWMMESYAEELLLQYDKKLVEQYVYGHPINLASSLVYYEFSESPYPNGNVDDSIMIDPYLPYCLSMDFNAVPGIHAVLGQYHRDLDEIWIIDEFHRKGMMIPGMINAYADKYGSDEKKPMTQIYGDASGNSRDTAIGETAYAWVRRCMQEKQLICTMKVPKANPLREDRFISANAGFESGGVKHVRIHPRCEKLIRDFRSVQRDELGRLDKSQEKQGFVHISDAATYFIHTARPINRTTVSGFTAR